LNSLSLAQEWFPPKGAASCLPEKRRANFLSQRTSGPVINHTDEKRKYGGAGTKGNRGNRGYMLRGETNTTQRFATEEINPAVDRSPLSGVASAVAGGVGPVAARGNDPVPEDHDAPHGDLSVLPQRRLRRMAAGPEPMDEGGNVKQTAGDVSQRTSPDPTHFV